MADERRSKSASEILQTLHSLSLETEEEILAMSRAEVRARLSEEGIDLTAAKQQLTQKLKEVRGRQLREAAREGRLARESAIPQSDQTSLLSIPEIQSEVSRLLAQLSKSGSPNAQFYYNRFKDSPDEDLATLLEDLQSLTQLNQEGDPEHDGS